MQGRPLTLFGMRVFLLSLAMLGSPYHCGTFSFPGIANVVTRSYGSTNKYTRPLDRDIAIEIMSFRHNCMKNVSKMNVHYMQGCHSS